LGLALAAAAAVLVADQLTKWAVLRSADGLPATIVGGVRLALTYNSGISFSRLAGRGSFVLVLVAVVAAAVVVALALAPPRYKVPLGIILGGAVGNLIDRLRFDGAVLDFVALWWWPAFNVADIAVVAGTAFLMVRLLRGQHA
jgi:signal peptidase II